MKLHIKGIKQSALVFLLTFASFYPGHSIAQNVSDNCQDSINLVNEAYFDIYHDKQGSHLDTSKTTIKKNMLNIAYHVVKLKDTTMWPNFMFHFFLEDYSMWKGFCKVKVTYKADHPIWVSIPQAILLDYGHSYNTIIPATDDFKTIYIRLKDFKQPHWSTHKDIPLNLNTMQGIAFAPNTEPQRGASSGHFELKEVVAYGVSNIMKDTLNAPIIFHGIKEGSVFASVKKAGSYNVEIFNSKGEMVCEIKNTLLKKNYNRVKLTKNLVNGIYYIRIYNDEYSIKKLGVYGNTPSYTNK